MTAHDRHIRAVAFDAATVFVDTRDGAVSALIHPDHQATEAGPTVIAGADPGPNWGTRVQPVALDELPPVSTVLTVLAAAGLGIVLTVAACGRRRRAFARHLAILRLLPALRLPAASPGQIADTITAVRRIGRRVPFRVACLEEATSTILVLALHGRSAAWCHGVAPDPVRLHAWVSDRQGNPIAEPPETTAYTTMLRVPDR